MCVGLSRPRAQGFLGWGSETCKPIAQCSSGREAVAQAPGGGGAAWSWCTAEHWAQGRPGRRFQSSALQSTRRARVALMLGCPSSWREKEGSVPCWCPHTEAVLGELSPVVMEVPRGWPGTRYLPVFVLILLSVLWLGLVTGFFWSVTWIPFIKHTDVGWLLLSKDNHGLPKG